MAKFLSLKCRLLFFYCSFCVLAYTSLTDESLRSIPDAGDAFNIETGALLAPILIPRVSGSEGSTKVLNHLVDFFHKNLSDWVVTFQNSTAKTPATGDRDIPFINMIATRQPPWRQGGEGETSYLTLAAHYDSKLTPDGFIGAVDSAAPCAMLMQAARNLDSALTKRWDAVKLGSRELANEENGLQILFLDGEEAFLSWSSKDSLYGARSLAEEWESTSHAALSTFRNPLASISLFLLLDLLGAKDPAVPSYFATTHWAYEKMVDLEKRLRKLDMFKSSPNHSSKRSSVVKQEPLWLYDSAKAVDSWLGGLIEDDHIPFLARGVEVLHMIPSPFPRVWHKMDDNGENLDIDTVEDWATLVTAFAAEWLDLEGYMGAEATKLNPRSEFSA